MSHLSFNHVGIGSTSAVACSAWLLRKRSRNVTPLCGDNSVRFKKHTEEAERPGSTISKMEANLAIYIFNLLGHL